MIKLQFYGEYEDEIFSLSDDDYKKLQQCPNCNEHLDSHLDRFPTTDYGKDIGNFFTMRCLSCGRFFSLSKNYENKFKQQSQESVEIK